MRRKAFFGKVPGFCPAPGAQPIMTMKRVAAYTAAGLGLLVLVSGAWFAGGRFGGQSPLGEFTVARWNEDLAAQGEHLARIEQNVDDQVSALATRVGRMQAQLIRLDALGHRLSAVVAQAGRIEVAVPAAMEIGGAPAAHVPHAHPLAGERRPATMTAHSRPGS